MTFLLTGLLATVGPTTTTVAHHSKGVSLLDPIAKPIAAVLAGIYSVIPNYGVAIMVLSLIWMIIISPLTLKSTRSMLAMQKLQPELKKLQDKHKNDRQAFAQAQMDLFREHNVSPFGSCLPMLLPMPVFFALFRVVQGLGRASPKYLNHGTQMYKAIVAAKGNLDAFGMNLSQNAFSHHANVLAALPFWLLVLVMAGTGYIQSAQMMSRNPAAANNPQMRMMKYLPVVFTVIFIRFPAGVLLYYAVSNVCRIAQQDLMYRFDPKVKALVVREVVEVEELTQELDEEQGRTGKGGQPPRGSGAGGSSGSGRGRSGGGSGSTGRGQPAKPTGSGGRGGTGAGGSKPASGPKPTSGSKPSGGRSRFRDILTAAAEQQQQRAAGKDDPGAAPKADRAGKTPPTNGSSRNGSPSNGAGTKKPPVNGNGAGSGKGRTGATPSGPPAARKPNQGNRTNRKRRGR